MIVLYSIISFVVIILFLIYYLGKKTVKPNKQKNTGSKDRDWDNLDWSELTQLEQKNWTMLGHNKKKWDNDIDPPSEDKDWDELNNKEKKAAKMLGYNEEKWNKDD